jgi:putative endopeptidase
VSPTDHFGNMRRASANDAAYWFAKAEKPVDPDTWFMNPHEVNAYYNPPQNEIAFPAGILQPPFFAADAPKASNYGAMGMVMGHEITHGFDDEGRKYDGTGLMRDWWSDDAVNKFESAAQCVVDQYGTYEPLPELKVNGELTLGENIADLGGARLAYRAYRQWVAEHGAEPEVTGLTPEQQFWVSFGQAWCTVSADQTVRVRVQTDPHSPPRFRINGPVVNLPEFSEAFQCPAGAPMHPTETCEVW